MDYMKNKEISILIVGRICEVKQQVEIVRRTKNRINENVRFYFAGTGKDTKRLIKEIGNLKQYVYLGYKKATDIIDNYDYVCLFSKNEGFPLSLIEACVFGKPLITNDICAMREVNKDGFNGFVFHDFDELVAGLNNLPANYTEEYRFLSNNARRLYEENFTEDIMISKYKEYINKLNFLYRN